jgi:hypothetical protein
MQSFANPVNLNLFHSLCYDVILGVDAEGMPAPTIVAFSFIPISIAAPAASPSLAHQCARFWCMEISPRRKFYVSSQRKLNWEQT